MNLEWERESFDSIRGYLTGHPETTLFLLSEVRGGIHMTGAFIPDSEESETWDIENAKSAAEKYMMDWFMAAREKLSPEGESDSFSAYMHAQSETRTAHERYNYASSALENARIKERLAEIKSQHEPLASLLNQPLSERDRLCAAAFYVVAGRMPDK